MSEQHEYPALDSVIHLVGPDGRDVAFEFVDAVKYQDRDYVVLLPAQEEDADEVVIMRVEGEGEMQDFITRSDDREARAVFAIFREQCSDLFDFAD